VAGPGLRGSGYSIAGGRRDGREAARFFNFRAVHRRTWESNMSRRSVNYVTWKEFKSAVDAKLNELGKDDSVSIDYIDIDGRDLRGRITMTIAVDSADQLSVH
jgi:hypothetical protein